MSDDRTDKDLLTLACLRNELDVVQAKLTLLMGGSDANRCSHEQELQGHLHDIDSMISCVKRSDESRVECIKRLLTESDRLSAENACLLGEVARLKTACTEQRASFLDAAGERPIELKEIEELLDRAHVVCGKDLTPQERVEHLIKHRDDARRESNQLREEVVRLKHLLEKWNEALESALEDARQARIHLSLIDDELKFVIGERESDVKCVQRLVKRFLVIEDLLSKVCPRPMG